MRLVQCDLINITYRQSATSGYRGDMRVAPAVTLSKEEHLKLSQFSRAKSCSVRLAERSKIVLLAADGRQDKDIAEVLGITRQKASRWRRRYLDMGIEGLQKDAPRPGRKKQITQKKIEDIVRKTIQEKPKNATHWSTRLMAREANVSEATIRRIWKRHGLKPHLIRKP